MGVLKLIVDMGELQLSSKERDAILNEKKQEIIYYIHTNWEDPKTKLPHPMVRLEGCFKEKKCKVDPNGDVKSMAEAAVKNMTGTLFFAKAVGMQGTLRIAMKHMGIAESLIRKFTTVTKTDYEGAEVVYGFECSRSNLQKFQDGLLK